MSVVQRKRANQSCKSGWALLWLKFVKLFGPISGLPAYIIFSQRRTLLSPVTVEPIELIKSSIKNDCELFGRNDFATSPIPHSCAYLDSFGKFDFQS